MVSTVSLAFKKLRDLGWCRNATLSSGFWRLVAVITGGHALTADSWAAAMPKLPRQAPRCPATPSSSPTRPNTTFNPNTTFHASSFGAWTAAKRSKPPVLFAWVGPLRAYRGRSGVTEARGHAKTPGIKLVTLAKRQKPLERAQFRPGYNYVTNGYHTISTGTAVYTGTYYQ